MRVYTVVIIQLMIWSGFTFIEWLSSLDWFIYKLMMFFIFIYLAIVIGNQFTQSTRKTVMITIFSLCLYGFFHMAMLSLW
ncbi:hypothetical protein [Bacillus tuaregi]|uniref:hypothetical protein n=1 Tax=Bacillus tuaregi TaxID=1816695 RepID=UPI0008F87942|nr:hypothetical protein [Bacillus tuaregi]